MIVLTISNWRRKLIWILALVLVIAVLAVSQATWRQEGVLPAQTQTEQVSPAEKGLKSNSPGFWESIWLKLKEYYRGK